MIECHNSNLISNNAPEMNENTYPAKRKLIHFDCNIGHTIVITVTRVGSFAEKDLIYDQRGFKIISLIDFCESKYFTAPVLCALNLQVFL